MFELSIARRYLFPRWRQISVSIISTLSVLVIALVVWLIVVFFSVKDGLESGWINTIVALTAPVRITPTEHYFKSYYYLADTISSSSNYTAKTIGEKLAALSTDPYNMNEDEEIPSSWAKPDLDSQESLIDPVKLAFNLAGNLKTPSNILVTDYETAVANISIQTNHPHLFSSNATQHSHLEHVVYLGSVDDGTQAIGKALLKPEGADVGNLLYHLLSTKPSSEKLTQFLDSFEITTLETPPAGWKLPPLILPQTAFFQGVFLPNYKGHDRLIIPSTPLHISDLVKRYHAFGASAEPTTITIENGQLSFTTSTGAIKSPINDLPIYLEGGVAIEAVAAKEQSTVTPTFNDILFTIQVMVQGNELGGEIHLGTLIIQKAFLNKKKTPSDLVIPSPDGNSLVWPDSTNSQINPILLPKSFKDAGALLGDLGYVSYFSPTPSAVQEQRLPVVIAGFYDPGIMPIGSKYVIGPKSLVAEVHGSIPQGQAVSSNGINIRFDTIKDAGLVKQELTEKFKQAGIAPYWKIETYQEFEFTKDLIQQLNSEKNLFSLISLIIIIVACSNIISMLIILVNDKKIEIGILRSMGATWGNIAALFGFCGMVIGALGSLIGIGGALLTLAYINELVNLLSRLQGYDLFNPVFYGTILPSTLSFEALSMVFGATALISLLAGIVPAIKASLMRPSAILRAE